VDAGLYLTSTSFDACRVRTRQAPNAMVAVLVPLVGRPRAQMEPLVDSFFQCAAACNRIPSPFPLSDLCQLPCQVHAAQAPAIRSPCVYHAVSAPERIAERSGVQAVENSAVCRSATLVGKSPAPCRPRMLRSP